MLRKLLAAPAALTVVVALAASGNAQNDVGSNTNGTYAVTAVNSSTITVTQGDLVLGCDSASAIGVAIGGATNTYLRFSDLGVVNCEGPSAVAIDVTVDTTCTNSGGISVAKTGVLSNGVGTAGVDTAVNGTLNAGTSSSPCINVSTWGGLCTYDLYGSSWAVFNETVKPSGSQSLTISGNTLTIGGVSGLCPGMSNGHTAGFNIAFDVSSPSGPINLKPSPVPTAIKVGDSTTGTHPAAAARLGDVFVELGDLSLTCTDASATGTAIAGAAVVGTTYLDFDDLNLADCEGPGGVNADIEVLSCTAGGIDIAVSSGYSLTAALSDTVTGALSVGTSGSPCLRASTLAGLCQFDLYGTTAATFDEAPVGGAQELTISGTGLKVANLTGLCPGVTNGDSVGLNLAFAVTSPDGPINLM